MKTHLFQSLVLTDEHPEPAKEKPASDFDARKTCQPEDGIMAVLVQPVVSVPIEVSGKNYILPIYFHGFASFSREMK